MRAGKGEQYDTDSDVDISENLSILRHESITSPPSKSNDNGDGESHESHGDDPPILKEEVNDASQNSTLCELSSRAPSVATASLETTIVGPVKSSLKTFSPTNS